VTYKTRPVVTITAPADSGTYTKSALTVELGFSQAESATFVNATIKVLQGTTVLETLISSTRASTLMGTAVANGVSYSVTVTVIDSNGLTSTLVTSAFSVVYTLPPAAGVTATYLPDSGIGQIGLSFPEAVATEAVMTGVTITRTIDGVAESVVSEYPAASVPGSSVTVRTNLVRYPNAELGTTTGWFER